METKSYQHTKDLHATNVAKIYRNESLESSISGSICLVMPSLFVGLRRKSKFMAAHGSEVKFPLLAQTVMLYCEIL